MLDKINQVFVNENKRPLQNIRIRHTLVIDDPFEGREAEFGVKLSYPSRSPSPVRHLKATNLKDIEVGEVFLEDDIDLETMKTQQTL